MKRTLLLLGMMVGVALATSGLASADTPGRHPFYIHARTDLRTAQLLLRVPEEANVNRHQHRAGEQIERAIRELDHAAIIDRKDMLDYPPVDTQLDRISRFRRIMELLNAARRDLGREEDNVPARGWRDAAYVHIDAAIESVRAAARTLAIDRSLGF